MDATTEGRLLALRQALALLIAGRRPDEIVAALSTAPGDGQEDPGAVDPQAAAIEAAAALERSALAREIRLRKR